MASITFSLIVIRVNNLLNDPTPPSTLHDTTIETKATATATPTSPYDMKHRGGDGDEKWPITPLPSSHSKKPHWQDASHSATMGSPTTGSHYDYDHQYMTTTNTDMDTKAPPSHSYAGTNTSNLSPSTGFHTNARSSDSFV